MNPQLLDEKTNNDCISSIQKLQTTIAQIYSICSRAQSAFE